MKKLMLIAALAMFTMAAQAVTFQWKVTSSAQLKFGGSSVGTGATAYLVFLGTDTVDSLKFDDVIAMDTLGSTATAMGKVNNSKFAVTVDGTGAGNYAMFATYTSGGDTWYNVSGTTVSLSKDAIDALFDEGTALSQATFAFANTDHAKGVAGSVGTGWYAVPEPATGALALAGLALLFRRRRA